jgi:FdhD protein
MAESRPGRAVRVPIVAWKDGAVRQRSDEVATEEPLEIRVVVEDRRGPQRHSVAVTMRTPGNDFELAAGFLFTEGVIRERQAISHIAYCTEPGEAQQYNIVNVHLRSGVRFDAERLSRHVFTSSSCGVCGKASLELVRAVCPRRPAQTRPVPPELVLRLPESLRQAQAVFERTGGLHATALFDLDGTLRLLREDVGRHNAMDKVVGAALMQDHVPLDRAVALVSGRTSFEVVQKALMGGIPILAAVGAPSSLAVNLAREFDMTLIGFLRDGRFNVYAGSQQIGWPNGRQPPDDSLPGGPAGAPILQDPRLTTFTGR